MLPNKKAIEIIRKYMGLAIDNNVFERDDFDEFGRKLVKELIDKNLLVKTEDGTYTLKAEDENELMHSKIGALKEAVEKFAIPSDIKGRRNPKILDLCSGFGYNAVAALHFNKDAEIDMVELCREVLFLSLCLNIPFKEHEIIKEAIKNFFKGKDAENSKIRIFNEDARKAIKRLDKKYDIVFHDAFSPQRDPILYTVDFLKEIYKKMNDNGVLISYSSSIPFRSGLVEAGFVISEGPSVGRKRGATIAYKNPSFDVSRIPEVDERVIALSTVGVPYRDEHLNATKEEIIKNREIEREKFKRKLMDLGKYYSTKKIKKGNIDEEFLKIQKMDLNSSEIIKRMRTLLLNPKNKL
ncbi:MnmC family methyltransferase [Methanotorris igneus]|uniref:MnmC-like methyltransferase domain-containing protein n=1 Tax=Methanotorris igneus (strain DSM 5666 / JCM 11834 / Kol 5) TaxID=880724 RepID=F6BE41_METIK|nr:MnmC family methyltransferase [Methanotorris igneus]AEF95577.1 protein of unknown function DUF752 [Methanotorris igneus Kol 5]